MTVAFSLYNVGTWFLHALFTILTGVISNSTGNKPKWTNYTSVVIKDLTVKDLLAEAKTKAKDFKAKVLEANAKAKGRARSPQDQGLVLEDTSKYVQTKHLNCCTFSKP